MHDAARWQDFQMVKVDIVAMAANTQLDMENNKSLTMHYHSEIAAMMVYTQSIHTNNVIASLSIA